MSISAYPNERYFEFNSKKVVKTDGKISLRSLIHLMVWSILLTIYFDTLMIKCKKCLESLS